MIKRGECSANQRKYERQTRLGQAREAACVHRSGQVRPEVRRAYTGQVKVQRQHAYTRVSGQVRSNLRCAYTKGQVRSGQSRGVLTQGQVGLGQSRGVLTQVRSVEVRGVLSSPEEVVLRAQCSPRMQRRS